MMRPLLIAAVCLAATACGGGRTDTAATKPGAPAPAGAFVEGGSGFTRYYREEPIEVNERKRILIFGTPEMYEDYKSKGEMNPTKSRTYIGKGPNKETVVVEASTSESPQRHDRLKKRFAERHNVPAF